MLGENGRWEGISIDLLAQVAEQAGPLRGRGRRAAGAHRRGGGRAARRPDLTIIATAEGESRVDYSNSYFQSGLAVAIPDVRPVTVLQLFGALASQEFRSVLGVLIALTAWSPAG